MDGRELLLVEDEPDTRAALEAVLRDEGYRVITAGNGAEALKALSSGAVHPELVLLDLLMPVMDGYTFLARRAADPALAALPVLVLTGVVEAQARDRLAPWKQEIWAVLHKPLEISLLLKKVETALRAASTVALPPPAELLQMLEASNDGFWDWNIQTGAVHFSRRWAEMLGYALEEIEPSVRSWERLVHPEDMPHVQEVLQAHLDGKISYYETEHRVRTRDGQWKWILDRGKVISRDDHGRPLRAVGAHVDVTERKHHEAEREQALAQREQLLGIVSHELRNPLNALMASAELIRRVVRHLLPHAPPVIAERSRATLDHALDSIVRSTDRMKRLVEDLLTSTRLEAGKLPVRKGLVVPEHVLSQAHDTLDAFACRHHVSVDLQVERGLPNVEGDEDRLVQVVTNLLHNALKFSPEGGHVHLRALRSDGRVRLEIEDEGPGISPEERAHLFERFWHGRERAYVGAGLGLYISKGIVDAHGGNIELASAPGHGTRFQVDLPAKAVAATPAAG